MGNMVLKCFEHLSPLQTESPGVLFGAELGSCSDESSGFVLLESTIRLDRSIACDSVEFETCPYGSRTQ